MDTELEIAGYPGDKEESNNKSMWKAKDKPNDLNDNFVYYKIPTSRGQSGSPIIKEKDGKYYIVGIHIAEDSEK